MTTLNLVIGAGVDDAYERNDSVGFTSAAAFNYAANADSDANGSYSTGGRFTNVTIGNGDTIDTAVMQVQYNNSNFEDDPLLDIHMEDVDDSANFTTTASVASRARTTASTFWDAEDIGLGYVTSPDFTAAVQEVVDRGGWASGNAMMVIQWTTGRATQRILRTHSYDDDSAKAWKLDITYTAAGFTGTGAWSYPMAAFAGTGAQTQTASGAFTYPMSVFAGTGTVALVGTGAYSYPMAVWAGTGSIPASGAFLYPMSVFAGEGAHFAITASITVTLGGVTAASVTVGGTTTIAAEVG